MCLIVDVNVAHKVLLADDDPDFHEVHRRLFSPKANPVKIVYGGKLAEEYLKNNAIRGILAELNRAGRAILVSEELVQSEDASVIALNLCQSNDTHIIALARAGKVRLLCSDDKALCTDFTNKLLLDKPRGKVYGCPDHNHLLRTFCKQKETEPSSRKPR